jgi:hypothetical protein
LSDAAGAAAGIIGGIMLVLVFVLILGALIMIVPHWKIFERAGYSGALSLLMFIPLVNLIVLVWFAFSDWPALRALSAPPAVEPERRFGR